MYHLRLKHISIRYQNCLKWVTRKGIIKFTTEILIPFREGIEHVSECDTFSERYIARNPDGIEPSWRRWESGYVTTGLRTSLFWHDLSMCAIMCEECVFSHDCKDIVAGEQVQTKDLPVHGQGLHSSLSNFCIYVLGAIPGHGFIFN